MIRVRRLEDARGDDLPSVPSGAARRMRRRELRYCPLTCLEVSFTR